jgi:predicted kinase
LRPDPGKIVSKLIVVCGLSFAGKSTLAREISARFGYTEVDVDATKVDLHGPGIHDEQLTQDEWTLIYRETDDRMLGHLRSGESVVDGSRNFRKHERDQARQIAERAGADLVVVYVDTPEAVVRRRWAENKANPTRRVVSDTELREIIAAIEAPTADERPLVCRHGDTISDWIADHAADLGDEQRS